MLRLGLPADSRYSLGFSLRMSDKQRLKPMLLNSKPCYIFWLTT